MEKPYKNPQGLEIKRSNYGRFSEKYPEEANLLFKE